jgi:RNA 3'-terminal phosphate cyclase (ATP)
MAKKEKIVIDGGAGEGGGQVLRTSLALSLITGKPVVIQNIRGGRAKPGLLRQHLTALNAAAEIGAAKVEGAAIGSREIAFVPGKITPGDYRFAIGTAGSATLVLQTVLPALMTASGPSTVVFEGGTHNPAAPPFDFLAKTFLPVINRMGPRVEVALERHGFYPAGGGRFKVTIDPAERLKPVDLLERGQDTHRAVKLLIASLPRSIAERERDQVREKMGWPEESFEIHEVKDSCGPGNVVLIECGAEHVTEVFVAFGEKGVPAAAVADRAVNAARAWLGSGVAVGRFLADQLLLPFVLAGGGSFRTLPLSRHSETNIEVIRKFVEVEISTETGDDRTCTVQIRARRPEASELRAAGLGG